MKIAGRCFCGMLSEWAKRHPFDHVLCASDKEQADPFCSCGVLLRHVATQPDKHMRCFRLRWCGVCGDVAPINKNCPTCSKRHRLKYRKTHGLSDKSRASARIANRRWAAKQRRQGTAYYEREKARRRERYATDPAYAQAKRDAARRQSSRRKRAETPQNNGVFVSGLRELVNLPFGRRPSLRVA